MCPYCYCSEVRQLKTRCLDLLAFFSTPTWLAFLCLTMMDLEVCSLSVRGLGEKLNRRGTFNWLRAKNYSIYLLRATKQYFYFLVDITFVIDVLWNGNVVLIVKVVVNNVVL